MRLFTTWLLSIILALAFIGAAFAKFTAQPSMVTLFQSFNYPLWFMYVTGLLELMGAVLVLIPRFASLGASLLSAIMVGALFSHLTHGQAGAIPFPLALLVLSLLVGLLRNPFSAKLVPAS